MRIINCLERYFEKVMMSIADLGTISIDQCVSALACRSAYACGAISELNEGVAPEGARSGPFSTVHSLTGELASPPEVSSQGCELQQLRSPPAVQEGTEHGRRVGSVIEWRW